MLEKIVASVEVEKDRGNVAYTFPLSSTGIYAVPPGEFSIKVRTLEYERADE